MNKVFKKQKGYIYIIYIFTQLFFSLHVQHRSPPTHKDIELSTICLKRD